MGIEIAFADAIAAKLADEVWPDDVMFRIRREFIAALVALARRVGAYAEEADDLAIEAAIVFDRWDFGDEDAPDVEDVVEMAEEWLAGRLAELRGV